MHLVCACKFVRFLFKGGIQVFARWSHCITFLCIVQVDRFLSPWCCWSCRVYWPYMVIFHMPGNNNVFIDRFNKRMCSWNIIDHIVDNSLEEILVTPWKCNREPVSRRFFQRDKWDRVISNFSSSVVNTGFTLSPFKNEPLQLWSWNNFLRTHKSFFFKAVWFLRVHEFFRRMVCR